MATMSKEQKEILGMTAQTIGKDLLAALVQEIRLLPKPWAKLSEEKQNDIIDRLRKRVDDNVKMAVFIIGSNGRTVVAGDLDQVTIKGGVKAVIKFSEGAPSIDELYRNTGKAVLVTIGGHEEFTGGMDEVKGESDQRDMDLGDSDGAGVRMIEG